MSDAYDRLRSFILERMRMAHIYQPLMLKTLIEAGGRASIREIAANFLARDESQLEYYEEITKRMPGKVLGNHGMVVRDGDGYRPGIDPKQLGDDERHDLLKLCDEAVETYLGKRGTAAYDHRRAALGYVSGSVRYEVLKRAGGRCYLCGVSIEECAIEIDHIVPRKHGGSDDPSDRRLTGHNILLARGELRNCVTGSRGDPHTSNRVSANPFQAAPGCNY